MPPETQKQSSSSSNFELIDLEVEDDKSMNGVAGPSSSITEQARPLAQPSPTMDVPQVNNLKRVDEDICAMLKFNEPDIEWIEKKLEKMQRLIEEMGSNLEFALLKTEWVNRLNLLKKELECVSKYDFLETELSIMKGYIQTLLEKAPTSEEIKPNIDKFSVKVNKIFTGNFKNYWTLVTESLKNDYSKLESPQSSGSPGTNGGSHSQSSSSELSVPTFSTPNVSKPFSNHDLSGQQQQQVMSDEDDDDADRRKSKKQLKLERKQLKHIKRSKNKNVLAEEEA